MNNISLHHSLFSCWAFCFLITFVTAWHYIYRSFLYLSLPLESKDFVLFVITSSVSRFVPDAVVDAQKFVEWMQKSDDETLNAKQRFKKCNTEVTVLIICCSVRKWANFFHLEWGESMGTAKGMMKSSMILTGIDGSKHSMWPKTCGVGISALQYHSPCIYRMLVIL